jgi:TM2 domain-containing membrane protein YozV
MKQIVCEACGGKELVIQDGILICQHCDTKYFLKKKKKKKLINEETIEAQPNSGTEESFEAVTEKDDINWTTLSFLSFFLGWLGVDRYYVGRNISGAIKFFISFCAFLLHLKYDALWILILPISITWWLRDFYCVVKGNFLGFRNR